MKILWEVDDGYCGKNRPQSTIIDDEDLDTCETNQERESLIDEYIQNDFEQNIGWRRIG